jgi:hypothetical protein
MWEDIRLTIQIIPFADGLQLRSKGLGAFGSCTRNSVFCENVLIPDLFSSPNIQTCHCKGTCDRFLVSSAPVSGQWQNFKLPTRIQVYHVSVSVNSSLVLLNFQIAYRLQHLHSSSKEDCSFPLKLIMVFIVWASSCATGIKGL